MYSMKRIYLLRHAKSSWKARGVPDHDRPLAKRGRRAGKAIARHLAEQGIAPELVLCSTARRARETLARLEPAVATSDVRIEQGLYGANAGALLDRLRSVDDAVGSVLVIGHNPGIHTLALELARSTAAAAEIDAKFPTAALATLEFRGSGWQALAPGSAELTAFVRPRDLEQG
jgi:phosphohistidine phosphatase